LAYDVNCLRKKSIAATKPVLALVPWEPAAEFGTVVSEKNIIGLVMGTLDNTMFVSLYFLHTATELLCFIILTNNKANLW
jgi:hypothetical protein